jgi:hypothetical protein
MSAIARRAASSSTTLRCAAGCGLEVLGTVPRNAVETAVATASGTTIPDCASNLIHPSPSAECKPRTRATSYAISPTFGQSTSHGNPFDGAFTRPSAIRIASPY